MTYTEIINKVLIRLRETEVASPSDSTYSKLLGEYVNESKREVEDAWEWNVLRTTIQVPTEANVSRYELTGSGQRFRTLEVLDSTSKTVLTRRPHSWMTDKLLNVGDTGAPMYYDYNDRNTDGDTYVDVYMVPNGVYNLNFNLVIPQDDLVDGTTVIEVPYWPVVLSTYAKAIAERGEDQGNTHGEALKAASSALSDAIAIDISNTLGEDTWYV